MYVNINITASSETYRGYVITIVHHSRSIEGVDSDFYRVEIHSPWQTFESNNTFQDKNDALEYAKLMINKWHAERSILTNGTNTQQ